MATRQVVQAAPPDDGHEGAYTQPQQTLSVQPGEDTRASETLGETPLRTRHPNKGLAWFWVGIAALSALLVLVALLRR
jgi:hypothetical protein